MSSTINQDAILSGKVSAQDVLLSGKVSTQEMLLSGKVATLETLIGPPGPQGPKGDPGDSYTVKGLYDTLSALQAAHPTGSEGDAWFVGTSDSNVVYQWDVDRASWVNVGALKGPAGTGVPDGGTAGQLLSKTESGTEWIDSPQSGVQSDWNQNDETAPDYVKNRPFYTGDRVETVFVEESTVSFVDQGDGLYGAQVQSTFEAIVGKLYKVYWDGTTYECACIDVSVMPCPIIGNLSIIGMGSDTGEPFAMGVFNGEGIQITTTNTSASHTFSISGFVQEVVKIDEKYLPTIPADKSPALPVIEFTTNISANIGNDTQPSFNVSNLSYSEIYAIVEKGSFQIKDSSGVNYRPIRTEIVSSGAIFVDILVLGSPMTYASLACNANQTRFYRNNWWQIETTKK